MSLNEAEWIYFTLIELVVVIVILGILAVVAAPKFLNLQQDARDASLKGLKGSIESTLDVTYAKLATLGLENAPSDDFVAVPITGDDQPLAITFKNNVVRENDRVQLKPNANCYITYTRPSREQPRPRLSIVPCK